MAGSGRDEDEDEDEDEAMVWSDSGNLAAVLFGRESSENVSKVLAQGHYDRADLQNYSALWIRGLLSPLQVGEKSNELCIAELKE